MIAPLLAALLTISQPLQNTSHLYRTVLVRAAPGELLEVIRRYKERMPVYDAAGDERPLMMRHSQGDHWDLLLIYPLGSFADFYASDRISRRQRAERSAGASQEEFQRGLDERLAWREDLFVWAPCWPCSSRPLRRPLSFTSRCSLRCLASEPLCCASARWRTSTSRRSTVPKT